MISKELDESLKPTSDGSTACNCLPSCTSLNYDLEISQADIEFDKDVDAYDEDEAEDRDPSLARLVIFFKDLQFITSRRSELYGLTDFLASCGGLLGKILF